MKKNTLLFFLSFSITTAAFSQTVDGIPLKELSRRAEYIRVSEGQIYLNKRIIVFIDYGQVYKIKDMKLLDQDGNPMQFNSMIEVLNFFSSAGYELVAGGDNISSFLLRRKQTKQTSTNTDHSDSMTTVPNKD